MSGSNWCTVFCCMSLAPLCISVSAQLVLLVCLPCSWLRNNAATFAEIILLCKMSNCSGCGRGVAAALLPGPQLPCLWILMKLCSIHTNWHRQFCSGKSKGGIEAGKWGERVRQDGDGDEQAKSSELEPSKEEIVIPPPPKKKNKIKLCSLRTCFSRSYKQLWKWVQRRRKAYAQIYGRNTDNCRLLRFSLLSFFLSN